VPLSCSVNAANPSSVASISGGLNNSSTGLASTIGGGIGVLNAADGEWHASQAAGFPAGGEY
jgi:hypothetical protein